MAYTKTTWEDLPSEDTPIVTTALQNIEDGIEALDTAYSGLLNFFYPVGTIYETTSTNLNTIAKMATHFGGTWEVYGADRFLIGSGGSYALNSMGGSADLQSHTHQLELGIADEGATGILPQFTVNARLAYYASGGVVGSTGTGTSGNIPPYIAVYRYRRTA